MPPFLGPPARLDGVRDQRLFGMALSEQHLATPRIQSSLSEALVSEGVRREIHSSVLTATADGSSPSDQATVRSITPRLRSGLTQAELLPRDHLTKP